MPRERLELFRESDSKPKEKIIVLAYEGNDTEKLYFNALKEDIKFNDEVIHLHILIRPKEDTNSAPKYVFNKLKKEATNEYNFDKDDELWMIIDRDRWHNIPEIVEMCKAQGNFFIAVSNPCFEFWLLLHLKDLKTYTEKELTDIFKNKRISKNRTHLERVLSDLLDDGYNKTNPRPERFLPYIESALNQAEALDNLSEDTPSKLGSHVYKVVKKMIKPN